MTDDELRSSGWADDDPTGRVPPTDRRPTRAEVEGAIAANYGANAPAARARLDQARAALSYAARNLGVEVDEDGLDVDVRELLVDGIGLVERYESTRDAALVDDRALCSSYVTRAWIVLRYLRA